ncbi:hypothetical protein HNR00_000319 [Methylorubrum rhodinum]|uniref:Uncharacterized protein n=1 Tax=Methylorubrum rhodinum TaxID=29428 RepID=A0A840ZEB7_9HYPH|nr:hypothetical protein [Methylorubrum rhodinum]MBB5755630.1 hypothetical protein [Methylorubrum rhodinum]
MAEPVSDSHEVAERAAADGSEVALRKFSAKRVNEHVKSVYAFAYTLAAAIIGAAYIIASVTKGAAQVDLDAPGWVLIGLTLHGFGHFVIWRFLRRED